MSEFDFVVARREGLKLRMAISGPGGSGKTRTALEIAAGVSPGNGIAFIDTENKRALEFADRFTFRHLDLRSPYTPDRFIGAIAAGQKFVGPDGVVIVDSLSHGWIGKGGVLEIKNRASADFSGWAKATPEQDKLMEAIMACGCHIICCMRAKVVYQMETYPDPRTGRDKTRPIKVGMAPVQRDGVDFEFSITGTMDMGHKLTITKASFDIMDGVFDKPSRSFGTRIRDWLDSSTSAPAEPASEPMPAPEQPPPSTPLAPAPQPPSSALAHDAHYPAGDWNSFDPAPASASEPSVASEPVRPARSVSPEEIRASLQEPAPQAPPPAVGIPEPAADDGRPPLPTVKWTKSLHDAFGEPDGPAHADQLKNIAVIVSRLGWTQAEGHDYVFTWVLARLGYEILHEGVASYLALRTAGDAQQVYAMLTVLREQQVAAQRAKARAS